MFKSNKLLINNLFSVKNKVCLITGSEGGMGKQISNLLKINGAKVICIDRIKKKKKNYYQIDLRKDESLLFFKKKFQKKFSKIDAIINLAGVTDPTNFENNFKVNLFGLFNLTNSLINLMKKSGGSIINITSLNAELGFSNNPGYNSSKGALKLLTKSLAVDYGKFNIRVNNLGPGYIKTKMTRNSFNDKKERNKRLERMVFKKYGKPGDLFGAIVYLISDSSSYVTGQDIYVDGGFLSKGI